MTTPGPRPPRLARWLLRLRPLGSRRAEIEADLHEVFVDRLNRYGAHRAALRYYLDVLSVWRWNPSGVRLLRDAAQDLTHGLRIFRHNPGAVAVTILGLALAIAVSTSVFSVLNIVAFRDTGVADPGSAVRVQRAWARGVSAAWPYGDYLALREGSRQTVIESSLSGGARFSATPSTFTDDTAQPVSTMYIGGGYLGTFGARPWLGRILGPADDAVGAPPAVVVSHGFWTRSLDADRAIVGRQLWLNGVPVTVVGVTDPSFTGIANVAPALWIPFAVYPALSGGSPFTRESATWVDVVGRKPAGSTIAQAEAELSVVAAAMGRDSRDPYRPTGVRLESARSINRPTDAKVIALMVAFVLTVVGLVMLLACVNVANLQFASAIQRQREIGVRLALGATRARLIRQLVTESLVLGLAAGVIGLLITMWLVPTVATLVRLPVTINLAIDLRVYLFLAVVSVMAGVGAGLAPARHGTRGDLMTPLKGDGPRVGASGRPSRLRAALIGVQAAASVVLLVAAALLTRAAVRAAHVDLGFDAQHLVAVTAGFGRGYDEARTKAYWDLALERIRAAPGVRAAALADHAPYLGHGVFTLAREGRQYRTLLTRTSPDYFATLGLRVVRGRTYTPQEVAAAAPVAVINETLAREFWPGADPIGASVETFDRKIRSTVIGIVSDSITARLRELRPATMYWPLTIAGTGRIVVRTTGQPETVVPSLRDALQPLDPRIRLDIALVADGLEKELDQPRILASLSGALAALALALALVGIYGVTSFVTGQRMREIGVRIAVGATSADVMRLLLADSLRPVSIGLCAGVAIALVAGRVFTGILYGIKAQDPVAFAGAVLVLFVSAAVAVYIPTRRASQADPVFVLRQS